MLRIMQRLIPWLVMVAFLMPGITHAAGLDTLGIQEDSSSDKNQKADAAKLSSSLDDIIQTLENDQKRSALLDQLKQLQETTKARAEHDSAIPGARGGLLGALSESFSNLSNQAEQGRSPVDIWRRYTQKAGDDLNRLFAQTHNIDLVRYLLESSVGLIIWIGALISLNHAGRKLYMAWDWPLRLPPEPRPWMLVAHFARRVLPCFSLFFLLLIAARLLQLNSPPSIFILVIAYLTLCGRLLSTVFDVVIGLFTRGHRRTAVRILHNKALTPLFIIGTLIAFGDAVNSAQLSQLLGPSLSDWLSVLANALAGLLCALLIMRIRRPVVHLIRNRPLRHRLNRGGFRELVFVLAQLWHVPALLLIGASLTATLVSGGQASAPFARAMICTVLLVLTLVITGIIRRQHERPNRRKIRNQYLSRLRNLGFTLAHTTTWLLFLELSARVWSFSLFGLGGAQNTNSEIGRALIRLGLTVLIAWLIWIIVDTAIQRSLHGVNSDGRRRNISRAQTVTPMIRNLVLFLILVVAGIIGLANLGVNVTPLLAGAGVIGIAIGFGAQTLVADLITGIFILIEDSLAVGDFVEINGFMGTVEGLNLRAVRLRDLDAVVHITTFSHIQSIHNMSREFGISLMKIRIPHDMAIDDAIELMRKTASDLHKDPFMRGLIRSHLEMQGIHEFDNGCPILRMRIRTAPEYQWTVGRAFNLALKRRMEADQISLGSPRMSIAMEAGGGARFNKTEKSTDNEKPSIVDWPTDDRPSPS